ncbi:hypothetical protein V8E51_009037 [Hyaloscypha variabilis]
MVAGWLIHFSKALPSSAIKLQNPTSLIIERLAKLRAMDPPSPRTPGGPSSEAVVFSALAVLVASVLFAAFLSGPAPAWNEEWESGWDAGWAAWAGSPVEDRSAS